MAERSARLQSGAASSFADRASPSILDELLRPSASGNGGTLPGRQQAWLTEEPAFRESQLGARAGGLFRVEARQRSRYVELEGKAHGAQLRQAFNSSEAERLKHDRELLAQKQAELDRREHEIIHLRGVADANEARARRLLQEVQEKGNWGQEDAFIRCRLELNECRRELHEELKSAAKADFAETREHHVKQEMHFQSMTLRLLEKENLQFEKKFDLVEEALAAKLQECQEISEEFRSAEVAHRELERFAEVAQQELDVERGTSAELNSELVASTKELQALTRHRRFEAKIQESLRSLFASSIRDHVLTFFDAWVRYHRGGWEPDAEVWTKFLSRSVVNAWRQHVEFYSHPAQLLRWLRADVDFGVLSWDAYEGRVYRQYLRYTKLFVLEAWHKVRGSNFWNIDLSSWPRGEQEESPRGKAERSRLRAEKAAQQAAKLRAEEEERQRLHQQRHMDLLAAASTSRADGEDSPRRRSTLKPSQWPGVLRKEEFPL
eukprot:TRINITY_DN40469_c0_g1_i1.p1 TRINITY_DN40469_c0_g1~~TRINITY_DN40469_c0_g1_i1.p1  ORF type:complete len:506 (-),score=107.38 TRINITY_DN40469_c0_g1_i1:10-1488(-)